MTLSIAIRIACEMGYHRDPDSSGSFTVFEGEMRRRFWAACVQMDLMMSFQLGLPYNINLDNCDTKPPRNLSDSDFDADSQVLPPSRSEEEPTYMLWFIVRDRQIVNFSKVCQDALSLKEKTKTEVFQLDQDIPTDASHHPSPPFEHVPSPSRSPMHPSWSSPGSTANLSTSKVSACYIANTWPEAIRTARNAVSRQASGSSATSSRCTQSSGQEVSCTASAGCSETSQ